MGEFDEFDSRQEVALTQHDWAALSALLRAGVTLKPATAAYLADVLEGKVKRPRGRKKGRGRFILRSERAFLRLELRAIKSLLNERGKSAAVRDVHREALEILARLRCATESEIEHATRPDDDLIPTQCMIEDLDNEIVAELVKKLAPVWRGNS